MRPTDPRIIQTINRISHNLESANQATQASFYTFSEAYLSPCLSSFQTCLEGSCQPCFAARDERQHRQYRQPKTARRGRESLAFDFYDDWEQDEAEWGNDELDRLLAGNEGQPGKHNAMSYGSRSVGKRKGMGLSGIDGRVDDPNVVPTSSMFGFLERLPWKIGGRGTRYKPNISNLQENVGKRGQEAEPLMDEEEGGGGQGRNRSGTVGSRDTTTSLSSRGDLFPSEDEDDAVPIDDEFAMVLERRTTTGATSEQGSGRKGGKRPAGSMASTRTAWSRDTKSIGRERRGTSISSGGRSGLKETAGEEDVPSLAHLKQEEERVQVEEEERVERRRQAAQRLASERGLSDAEDDFTVSASEPDSKEASIVEANEVPVPPREEEEEEEEERTAPATSPAHHTNRTPSTQHHAPPSPSDPEPKPPDESG